MALGDVHVLYSIEQERWVVKVVGSNVSTLHETKWEAVSTGRAKASRSAGGVELLVHALAPGQAHGQIEHNPAAA
jgi:Uncharacterized protein conserved in bacteria (DUF2188)